MAYICTIIVSLFAVTNVVAQVPPYYITYSSYASNISSLLGVSSGHSNLVNGLNDIGAKAGLSADQQQIYSAFINNLETTVINNGSITNETVKLFDISKQIGNFNVTQPQIFSLINKYNITGWTTVSNLFYMTNFLNMKGCLGLVVKLDADNNVPLIPLIHNALIAGGHTAEYNAFQQYINTTLAMVVKYSNGEDFDLMNLYTAMIRQFLIQNPSYALTFNKLDLGEVGSYYQFSQTGQLYYQNTFASEEMLGDVTTCNFLLQLNASIYDNTLPFPNTVRAQIKQFYNVLVQGFETITTLQDRLNFVSAKYGSFIGLQWNYFTWFQYCPLGSFGNLYQYMVYINTLYTYGDSLL